jgi:predicted phosphohydrolase
MKASMTTSRFAVSIPEKRILVRKNHDDSSWLSSKTKLRETGWVSIAYG